MNEGTRLQPDNRVIMISGASRGIGAAIAKQLATDGYSLSLGVRTPSSVDPLLSETDKERILVSKFEANEPDTATKWIEETINYFGRIDGLVNNAGILRQVGFEEGNEEDLDAMWAVNVKAPFRMIKQCLPFLRQSQNGRIINIASTDGKRYRESVSIGYTMAKHALVGLSHAARFAGWDDGIRVTALCPGAVNTDLVAHIPGVTPSNQRLSPETIATIVSVLLTLPNTASISEIPINTRLEATL